MSLGSIRRLLTVALALICAGAIAASTARASAAWAPNDDDYLLLEVRLNQYVLGNGLRGYRTPAGACLNLKDAVQALDIPVKIDSETGSATGWAFEEGNVIRIERKAGRVRYGGNAAPLGASAIWDSPEGWCVDAGHLSTWLGITLEPDLQNALLFVKSKDKLPVELAEERKARAARIRAPATPSADLPVIPVPYRLWRPPSLDAVITLGALSDRLRGERIDRRFEFYASGELARFSIDARLASDKKLLPSNLRVRAYRTDPTGNLLGPLRATHVAVGDVTSFASPLTGQAAPGRGAVLTNLPVDRPDSFDRTTLRGELPQGWDAELYRNGQLIAFTHGGSDGRYLFEDVAVLYGQNRFEVVLYGPQGQLRRRSETISVGQESIAAGKTHYWAGISQDDRDLIGLSRADERSRRGWRGAVGVEHGLDTRTSLAAQLQSFVIDGRRLSYAEGALTRSVGPALVEASGSYEQGGGYALRTQILAELGKTYVSGESIIAHDYQSDRVELGLRGRHSLALDHVFTSGQTIIPVHLSGRFTQRAGGAENFETSARASTNIRNFSITAAVDWRRDKTRAASHSNVEAALLVNGGIGDLRLRGEARWRLTPERRFEKVAIVGHLPFSERSDWRGELAYDHKFARGRAGLGYVRRFDNFALSLTGEAATDGSVAAGLNLAFSLGPDPRGGGMRVTSNKLASRGTAVARVFRDLNDDGVRQRHEPLEKGVQITAGTVTVEKLTDAKGVVVVDELQPFRPVQIGVDTSSLADPLLQPKEASVFVTPRPGVAMEIEIPLVGAGEIEGTLIRSGGGGLEGVDLELVNEKGRVVAVTRTDFDGYFLFQSAPYGHYGLRIRPSSAKAMGLDTALPQRIAVSASAPTARLGMVRAAYMRQAALAGGGP